ncbi:ParB-like nuclease domain family [Synechococcus sp. PCC 7335]|uniref:ParB/RepB/Spo0J family partition protein n=1 Tax=Synechococcus sp. (strain ATCC 29403 / PCC 7335) TaxID=91464 RepID=UPI00017EE4AE|nr:ParB N-terminal domain-containing protein [Synechococcus sp. PCC 7335]EDX82916.1 ParB-like nuclease domain family [Synechococcus sp. PCC 7335]
MNLDNLIAQTNAGSESRIAQHQNLTSVEIKGSLPFEDIKDRANPDSRPIDSAHVAELADSIAAIGLITPIAVDKNGCLLAGGHRRAALALIKASNFKAWNQHFPSSRVEVRVFDFDSAAEPSRALDIEVEENQQRKNYSPKEIRALADRLKNAGYQDYPGRPPKGVKTLTKALTELTGKSTRTVKGHLAKETNAKRIAAIQLETLVNRAIKAVELVGKHSDFSEAEQKYLQTAIKQLSKISL